MKRKRDRRRLRLTYSGEALHSEPPVSKKARLILTAYDEGHYFEQEVTDLAQIKDLLGKWPTTWLHVIGVNDSQALAEIGKIFGLHPLALEDVTNVHHRAKLEQYADKYFLIAHLLEIVSVLQTEQVSMFISQQFVVSIQQGKEDSFTSIRERLKKKQGKIRQFGADYLAYAILDTIIDSYYPVLEIYRRASGGSGRSNY